MLKTGTILGLSFGYIGLLFAIAHYGDKRAELGRSIVSNPYIYALSLAVYCTAWTFYGSVGRAAHSGLWFLPIYIGPTLTAGLGLVLLRKIIRIVKVHHITSIADFIASRYGKSSTLGSVVTIIAVLGVIPYISLQLKAISTSFLILNQYPAITTAVQYADIPIVKDTAFYVAMLLAVFAILFGTRHLTVTERHEGLVAAIAFESIVKLIAFICVGLFITYGMFDGFADIFNRAQKVEALSKQFTFIDRPGVFTGWTMYIILSMMAFMFLPRQFQVAVVENINEEHLNKAIWLFPLYLLIINIFVLPVAFGGVIRFTGIEVDPDYFVLTLPMAEQHEALALFVFIGGMSAATGMVIVEVIALSTMICNELVMPVLLRFHFPKLKLQTDVSHVILIARRLSIILILMLGYAYFRLFGGFYALVSIGLVSFVAVAQFAPAIIGGIFWKTGTRSGALGGLIAGFIVWTYTLLIPTMVQAGLFPQSFVTQGPFGIEFLNPFHLFNLNVSYDGLDNIAHAVFWSLLANTGVYIVVSLYSQPSAIEHSQATLFVDVFKYSGKDSESTFWRGKASVQDLKLMLERFLGSKRTNEAFSQYAATHDVEWKSTLSADAGLVGHVEKLLAGAVGSASARVLISSAVKEEPFGIDEVLDIVNETQQVIAYSRKLEKATAELKAANERLKELDRLKDEFMSTVTHELRTPLTSVRSLAEILHDNPDVSERKRKQFLTIIVKENERLTRLINQVLDFQKIESGRMAWNLVDINMLEVINDAIAATNQLIQEKQIQLTLDLPETVPPIRGDRDRLMQVLLNLISNAVKFCDRHQGAISIRLLTNAQDLHVEIIDNGIGIAKENQALIFEKFRQVTSSEGTRPTGSGLGLSISKSIVKFHKGAIWLSSELGAGSTFAFSLPISKKQNS